MKSILITGAKGGMGRATAALLAQQGYRVFALDRTLCDAQDNIIPIMADITQEESILSAYEAIAAKTDELYAIIHFAGIYMLDSLAEISNQDFSRIMSINLQGAYLINKTFLPLLQKGSRIVITTSELATLDPLPFTGIYAVSKAALDKYAFSLAMELQLLGITVSVLRAGAVCTDMLGISTDALDRFCSTTKLYTYNAKRFKDIVAGVEARNIPTQKIATKVLRILKKKKPNFGYSINRNPLLVLLNCLPKRMQLWVIKLVITTKSL
ncbi:MAG: SDR family NAD(P)-dependent oxidoreductase [Agathobacter sp.]|nr:SDR family NAD(P)-dependent oxidoreductase [Agathobacter sp.]